MRTLWEQFVFGLVAFFGPRRIFANAVIPGTVLTHPGIVNRALGEAIASRHLLVGHDIKKAGISTAPLGVVDDTGEAGELVAVALLGGAPTTLVMIASGAIAAGDVVVTAAGGKVRKLPAAAGTYQQVGVALTTTTTDEDEIEVVHCLPRPIVVS